MMIAGVAGLFCQCASSPSGEGVRERVDKIDRAIDENLPGLGPPPDLGDDPYKE